MGRPRSLDISYRGGKPMAAYLHLNRRPGDKSARTQRFEGDLVVDFATDGRPIGVEVFSPAAFSLAALNAVLAQLHVPAASEIEVSALIPRRLSA